METKKTKKTYTKKTKKVVEEKQEVVDLVVDVKSDVETKTEEVTELVEVKTEEVLELVETKTEVKVELPEEVVAEKSIKDQFLESISKIPFTISQNGVLICGSNPHLDIKATEKYFEINFKKYSYQGIEIKHG